MHKIACIGDLHFPFHCAKSLGSVYEILDKSFTHVVQMGDLYDFFSYSKFPKNPNLITPKEELQEGFEAANTFWEIVKKKAPNARYYQLLGNHDVRPEKRALELASYFTDTVIKSFEGFFKFRNVKTIFSTRDDLEIDGIIFEHGFFSKQGQHMKENMQPTVIGHTHRPWILYEKVRSKTLWEMNVGYLGNPEHEALSYSRKKWVKWVRSLGIIENNQPRIIYFE